jgi:hypothetical protein
VSLEPGSYRAERLESLDAHRAATEQLAARATAQNEVVFRCQSE